MTHERTSHDYLTDFSAERKCCVFLRTSELHVFLDDWSPETAETLLEMIHELYIRLYKHDYIGLADVEAMRQWLHTLIAIGYQLPTHQSVDKNLIDHIRILILMAKVKQTYEQLKMKYKNQGFHQHLL